MTRKIENYTPEPGSLSERTILVTGAGDGIGRAVASACAAHGASVILLGRTVAKLETLYDEIVAAGNPQPTIQPLDLAVAPWDDYLEVARALEARYGRLDGLVHNAAILGDRSPIEHYDVATWQHVLQVDLTAPFALTRACLPLLRQSKDASVVFTSSSVGRKGRAYWGAYAAAKAGLEALSEILADETAENTQIRANTLNPGKTRTAMRRLAYPFEDRSRLATPEEIVWPFLFLLGPDSRGITGQRFNCQD